MADRQDQRERTPERPRPATPSIRRYLQASPERAPTPAPPHKKARKSLQAPLAELPPSPPEVVSDSDEEKELVVAEESQAGIVCVGFSYPPVQIITNPDGSRAFKKLPPPPRSAKTSPEEEQPSTSAAAAPVVVRNPLSKPVVSAWEKGMAVMHVLMDKYKIEKEERGAFDFMPQSFEVYRKICHTWLQEDLKYCPLTFSSQKTFSAMMGRFLNKYVLLHAGIENPMYKNWEPTGCVVWEHRCTLQEGQLMCLHGLPMIAKDHVVEMDVSSEAGQRALKETPQLAKVVQNRWGRNVVQLRHDNARCCMFDAQCANNVFSGKSCGMFYSDGGKAQQAFRQIEAYMQAAYPHMQRGQKHLLMPLRCDCNYLGDAVPRAGRQVCKVTPFALPNAEDMKNDEVTDPVALASLNHPSLLVFQCANPAYRNTRATNQVNCDFKISATDVLLALQLVRNLWHDHFVEAGLPKMVLPEFKWQPRYQYKNLTLPTSHLDYQLNPFEF
ncbi:DNA-binding protein [Simian adenovirus A1258]|uniref:DNA-binding protein n=1 Tax=Simian adenovirus A1258 TaxID=1159189 RepID=H9AAI7_9ADEN|nr:DNA-binding protein [Simian adenovirus A1258]